MYGVFTSGIQILRDIFGHEVETGTYYSVVPLVYDGGDTVVDIR